MADIKLSKRMNAVVSMVTEESVADIGCDHAFVSIYLMQTGKVNKVIAMDVKKGPIDIAKANVSLYGYQDKIQVRLSDGFEKLKSKEVQCAVIAGMGGALIVDILKKGRIHTMDGISLVLQPQSECWRVREYLHSISYEITQEDMLVEEDKYYTILKAVPSKGQIPCYSRIETEFGRELLREKNTVLREFLLESKSKNQELKNKLEHIHTDKSRERIEQIKADDVLLDEALSRFN